jgi:hypothetical protein
MRKYFSDFCFISFTVLLVAGLIAVSGRPGMFREGTSTTASGQGNEFHNWKLWSPHVTVAPPKAMPAIECHATPQPNSRCHSRA